jgi:hypothetical protein
MPRQLGLQQVLRHEQAHLPRGMAMRCQGWRGGSVVRPWPCL